MISGGLESLKQGRKEIIIIVRKPSKRVHALFSVRLKRVVGEIYWFELHVSKDTVCNAVKQSRIVTVHYIFSCYKKLFRSFVRMSRNFLRLYSSEFQMY